MLTMLALNAAGCFVLTTDKAEISTHEKKQVWGFLSLPPPVIP